MRDLGAGSPGSFLSFVINFMNLLQQNTASAARDLDPFSWTPTFCNCSRCQTFFILLGLRKHWESQILPLKSSELSETKGWRAHKQNGKTKGKGSLTLTFTEAYVTFSLETQADNSDICSSSSCINIWGSSGMQYNPTKVKDRQKKSTQ